MNNKSYELVVSNNMKYVAGICWRNKINDMYEMKVWHANANHMREISVLLLLGRYFVYGEFLINELLIVGVLIIWSVSESIIAGLVILITKREIMGLAVCIVLYMLECSRHIQYSALRYFLNFVSRVLFDFHSYN